MCTVVCRWQPGEPVRILALRDEFVERDFDEPGAWWADQPSVIGGRDRAAGGSWCVTDVGTATTALVVNRIERFEGTPSRGLLPLAAVAGDWTAAVDHRAMAAFHLLVAGPDGATLWVWDTSALRRLTLGAGTHLVTSTGVDTGDAKTRRFAPRFDAADDWTKVVEGEQPSAEDGALVVRHEHLGRVYATVFGQLITASPGDLHIAHSRTPWSGAWTEQRWP